jgi:VWFA-related protein
MPKSQPLLFLAGLFCLLLIGNTFGQDPASTPGQPAFSDSVIYQPRRFPVPVKKSKSKKKVAAQAAPSPTREEAGAIDQGPVTIPVSVFDSSQKFVSGLQQSNFRVFVDGKKVEIFSIETRKEPLNFILLVDTSLSTGFVRNAMWQIVISMVEQLEAGDKVSIIKFAGDPTVVADLTDDREKVHEAIKKIKFNEDGTSVYDAVRFVFEKQIPAVRGRTVLLVLTDGVDTSSRKATFASSLEWAEKGDTTIFPVYFDTQAQYSKNSGGIALRWMNRAGISGAVASEMLDTTRQRLTLAGEYELGKMYLSDLLFLSGGHAIPAQSFQEAPKETASAIISAIRQQYVITLSPGQTGTLGQRKQLMVRVDRPNLAVLARGSYIVKPQ